MVEAAENQVPTEESATAQTEQLADEETKGSNDQEKENLVMDFSTAFKADTRRGKKKKKSVKKATTDQAPDGTDEMEPDALDDVNRDLEDDNMVLADDSNLVVEEIPRNLTITQE